MTLTRSPSSTGVRDLFDSDFIHIKINFWLLRYLRLYCFLYLYIITVVVWSFSIKSHNSISWKHLFRNSVLYLELIIWIMGVLLLTKQFKNLFWKCADEINGALFVNWQLVPTLHVVSLDKELNRKKRKTMCLLSCSLLDWAHVYNSNKKENFSCTTRHKTLYNTLLEQWTLKVKALARIFIYDNKVRIIFFFDVWNSELFPNTHSSV